MSTYNIDSHEPNVHQNHEITNQPGAAKGVPTPEAMDHNLISSGAAETSQAGEATYAVGYGRPPKATQFQPGRSGNPNGRPKGRRNIWSELADVYTELVSVTIDGRTVCVPRITALLMKQCERALEGNDRAIQAAFTN